MSWSNASTTVRHEGVGRAALRTVGVSTGRGRTTVVDDPRLGLHAPSRPPTQMELMLSAPRAVFTVDTAEHDVSWTLVLPSSDRPHAFSATVFVTWRVTDPVEAVRSGLDDPGAVCAAYLDPVLRQAAAGFRIGDSTQLNAHLDRLGLARPLSNGVSLVRFGVRVQLDGATRQHLEEMEKRRRAREIRAEDHLGVVQDRSLLFTEAEFQQRLDMQRSQFEQYLELQKAEADNRLRLANEANARQIEGDRMRFYAEALQGGDLNLIALRLSSNREEVQAVIGLFMQQRQLSFDQAHGVVNALLESGTLNRSDARDLAARNVKVIADHFSGPVFGLPGGGAAPAPGPGGYAPIPPHDPAHLPPAPADAVPEQTAEAAAREERRRRDRDRDAAEDARN